jgi:hypothetical protein
MSFLPGIITINTLSADQPVTSSTTLATIQNSATDRFVFTLPAGKRIFWELIGGFSLGATGGFKFQVTNSQTSSIYQAAYTVAQATTPSNLVASIVAQAAFANAAAVAANYTLNASGTITQGATSGTISFQFAQNSSDALSIILFAGTILRIHQSN